MFTIGLPQHSNNVMLTLMPGLDGERGDQALIVKEGARVMSLTDGTSKMSKSDPVEGSRINLTDSPDVITKKVVNQRRR